MHNLIIINFHALTFKCHLIKPWTQHNQATEDTRLVSGVLYTTESPETIIPDITAHGSLDLKQEIQIQIQRDPHENLLCYHGVTRDWDENR
jgi:hypothetical protein